jgi:hypothetical protein
MDVEIFGPVAAVMTFRTPEEAVQIANHTRYGLAATIWSENINLALDTAARMSRPVWCGSTPPTSSMRQQASAATASRASAARAAAKACSSIWCPPGRPR